MLTAQVLARNTLRRVGVVPSVAAAAPASVEPPEVWIPKHFYLYDTGALMSLYPCQIRPLVEAAKRDPTTGHFIYNTVLWSWPKKSAKSCIVAAMVDYLCSNYPHSSVKLVANDLKQADSRVGFYLRESIKLSAKHDPERAAIKIKPSGYLIEYPNASRVEMVPIDPSGEAGGNDDLIVYSELHGWKSTAHQRMWSEMTLSPTKFGRSQRWIDTYAGYSGESPVLENLYQQGVKDGRELFEAGSEIYANEAARLLCVWITRHLLPWQTNDEGKAYYAQEAMNLLPREYDRMHHNQWATSAEVFVQPEWWDACAGDLPSFAATTPVVIGMDAGVSNDCFALVGVSRTGDTVFVRFARIYKPPKGGTIDFDAIEQTIRTELVKTYNVIQMAYDPTQLHQMADRLTRQAGIWTFLFDQGERRAIADKQLYDSIVGRKVVHGNIPDLSEHVKNANAKVDPQEHSMRIVKRADHLKIDACVALSMAHHEVRRLNVG